MCGRDDHPPYDLPSRSERLEVPSPSRNPRLIHVDQGGHYIYWPHRPTPGPDGRCTFPLEGRTPCGMRVQEEPPPTVRIVLAPPNETDYSKPQPCGCSLDTGRCEVHAAMMRVVRSVYEDDSSSLDGRFSRIAVLADGFGAPGANTDDWSAFRDSSIPALEAMWKEAIR